MQEDESNDLQNKDSIQDVENSTISDKERQIVGNCIFTHFSFHEA